MERNLRKERIGVVASNKMDKTIVVVIERRTKHPIYGKLLRNQQDSSHTTRKMNATSVTPCASWKHVL